MIRALFDLKFDHLITRSLLGAVYGIAVAAILVSALVAAIALISSGGVGIVVGLVVVPLVALLYVLIARVVAEAVVVYFRIGEDVRAIRDQGALRP